MSQTSRPLQSGSHTSEVEYLVLLPSDTGVIEFHPGTGYSVPTQFISSGAESWCEWVPNRSHCPYIPVLLFGTTGRRGPFCRDVGTRREQTSEVKRLDPLPHVHSRTKFMASESDKNDLKSSIRTYLQRLKRHTGILVKVSGLHKRVGSWGDLKWSR